SRLHPWPSGAHGRLGSCNRNLDGVIAYHQFVRNIAPIEAAPPMLVVDWMTIHFGDEIPSHSEAEIGRSRLFRPLERNAKTRKLFRLRSKRIFPGKPDPANACPIHFVLGILPIDPASLPVGRMQQARFPP